MLLLSSYVYGQYGRGDVLVLCGFLSDGYQVVKLSVWSLDQSVIDINVIGLDQSVLALVK